jgi:hypothetical protein
MFAAVKRGTLKTHLLGNNVLVLVRNIDKYSVYAVMNFANEEETFDLSTLVQAPQLNVYYATTNARNLIGMIFKDFRALKVPASAAVIYLATAM